MINAKILNNTKYNQTNPFFPTPIKSKLVPWEGETWSLNHTSPHPKYPIGREEDSSGVLTVPPNLFKKRNWRGWMKNWLKNQDYHLIIDNWKTENSLDIVKSGCIRANSDKSMDFTIYKDEICKNITEIWGFTRISWNILRI